MMRVSANNPFVLTGTSPAAPGNAILATQRGLARYNAIRIDAVLSQATGGALDLYLQRRVATGVWLDWLHFASLTAGSTSFRYSATAGDNVLYAANAAITVVGQMNDDLSVGAFALGAGTFVGGLPGDEVRLCAVAGAGTSAGAVQSVYLTGLELFT